MNYPGEARPHNRGQSGPSQAEGLRAAVGALEAARADLQAGDKPAAASTVSRIARFLQRFGRTAGLPEVAAWGLRLELTPPAALAARVGEALEELREAVPDRAGTGRVLLVAGDAELSATVRRALATPERVITTVGTAAGARAALEGDPVDLLVLDLQLPDQDGRELLLGLGEGRRPMSILVLTDEAGSTSQTEIFALGADACFLKPIDASVVAAAAAAQLERVARFLGLSFRDPLTGLSNRLAFSEAFRRARGDATRYGHPMSVALLDLDRFKAINDSLGHPTGDRVLQSLARLLEASLREGDLAARWGGEEFAILFPRTDVPGAARALEAILGRLKEGPLRDDEGELAAVTFSAGVARGMASLEETMALADRRLYVAKGAGRARVVQGDQDPVEVALRTLLLVEDDDVVSTIVRHRMEREGFDVLRCRDGVDAIRSLPTLDLVAAILDVNLPGADGFRVLGALRADARHAHVPVVILTSVGSEDAIQRAFELGADDYMVKPFSPMELTARVHRLVREAS